MQAGSTGFCAWLQNQKDYNLWIANTAHSLGLAVGLKNCAGTGLVAALKDSYDWYARCGTHGQGGNAFLVAVRLHESLSLCTKCVFPLLAPPCTCVPHCRFVVESCFTFEECGDFENVDGKNVFGLQYCDAGPVGWSSAAALPKLQVFRRDAGCGSASVSVWHRELD